MAWGGRVPRQMASRLPSQSNSQRCLGFRVLLGFQGSSQGISGDLTSDGKGVGFRA